MNKQGLKKRETGTVLIVALWTLSLLSVFAVYLGVSVRQKIIFHAHIERRGLLEEIAQSGIKKGIAFLVDFQSKKKSGLKERKFTQQDKHDLFNNEAEFKNIALGRGIFDVSYEVFDDARRDGQTYYGLTDEGSRINVNRADEETMERLIRLVLDKKGSLAKELARAIIAWRKSSESEMVGFYSDAYYDNLQYPYKPKNSSFEILEELLLVKGMTKEIYDTLAHFLTVYGRGAVNLNSCSQVVLQALGFDKKTAEAILSLRRGPDGQDGTSDDFIFQNEHLNAQQLYALIGQGDMETLKRIFQKYSFSTHLRYYRIRGVGRLPAREERKVISCVFDVRRSKILSWREN